jgi:nucleoside 2-deoxyribosyltransferase
MKDRKTWHCFIVAPFEANIKPLENLLESEGIKSYGEFTLPSSKATSVSRVKDRIEKSDFLIAIISLKKTKPNEFFEIGLAHGLGKPIFLIVQDEGRLPIDIGEFVYVRTSMDNFDMIAFLTAIGVDMTRVKIWHS